MLPAHEAERQGGSRSKIAARAPGGSRPATVEPSHSVGRSPGRSRTGHGTQTHQEHDTHVHGPDCGHESIAHGDHVDYLHDGHRHREHDGHWDEVREVEEEVEELAADEAAVRRVASGER